MPIKVNKLERERRKALKKRGVCIKCHSPKRKLHIRRDGKPGVHCEKCYQANVKKAAARTKRKADAWMKLGLCRTCGDEPDTKNGKKYKQCRPCLKRSNLRVQRMREKRQYEEVRCPGCGGELTEQDFYIVSGVPVPCTYCEQCRDKRKNRPPQPPREPGHSASSKRRRFRKNNDLCPGCGGWVDEDSYRSEKGVEKCVWCKVCRDKRNKHLKAKQAGKARNERTSSVSRGGSTATTSRT